MLFLGPLARIGPNTLLTADVEQFHLMGAPRSPYTRSDWYLGFRLAPGVDNVFSMKDETLHKKRRAQMNMGVHSNAKQVCATLAKTRKTASSRFLPPSVLHTKMPPQRSALGNISGNRRFNCELTLYQRGIALGSSSHRM